MTEAGDFKIGMSMEFAKSRRTVLTQRKTGHGVWLKEVLKICGSPFNISETAQAIATSKSACSLVSSNPSV